VRPVVLIGIVCGLSIIVLLKPEIPKIVTFRAIILNSSARTENLKESRQTQVIIWTKSGWSAIAKMFAILTGIFSSPARYTLVPYEFLYCRVLKAIRRLV